MTGPGSPPVTCPNVFERSYRAVPARTRPGGAGLGLAIVARIAEHHHGNIIADSEPNAHAAFILTLPAQPPAAPTT